MTQLAFTEVDGNMQAPTFNEAASSLPPAHTMVPPRCILQFRNRCIWCNPDIWEKYVKDLNERKARGEIQ